MAKPKDTTHISINMPNGILQKIDNFAEKNHRDRSKEIIYACQMYIDGRSEPQKDTVITDTELDTHIEAVLRKLLAEKRAEKKGD